MIDTTGMSVKKAQEATCVTERAMQLRTELCGELQAFLKAHRNNEPLPASPLQRLKVECLARLALIADFHKSGLDFELERDPRAAIRWAIDYETIKRIICELRDIDCQEDMTEDKT